MSRDGARIKEYVCEEHKVKFNENEDYTTSELLSLIRNDDTFKLEHIAVWILGGISDWFRDNDVDKMNYVKSKVSQFLVDNPSPTGIPPFDIETCKEYDEFMEFYSPMTESERDQLKKDLCDAFTS